MWHHNGVRKKDSNAISFPDVLTINAVNYVATGAVLHEGVADGGHYIAYVRPNGATWLRKNDAVVTESSPHEAHARLNLSKVLYTRVDALSQ